MQFGNIIKHRLGVGRRRLGVGRGKVVEQQETTSTPPEHDRRPDAGTKRPERRGSNADVRRSRPFGSVINKGRPAFRIPGTPT